MRSHAPRGRPPVQFTSIRISGFGIRARADGRTGREAWRIIRQRHPRVVWLAAGYAAVLALIVVLWAIGPM